MKRMKMSVANIQGKLSRTEMKQVMAGSGDSGCGTSCSGSCTFTSGACAGKTGTCSRHSNGNCQCLGNC